VESPRDLAAWLLEDNPGWGRREIDAAIANGQRSDIRLAHKVPVAWVYLTGWATRDGAIHFRDDVYHRDEKPVLVAGARPQVASAARASGFVLQSGYGRPAAVKPVSYLDSQ
jgi:murein L,D-transpeptidase YcbB/YkuD